MPAPVKKRGPHLIVLVLGAFALAVVAAYAAAQLPEDPATRRAARRPLQPRLTAFPSSPSNASEAHLEFRQPPRPARNARPGKRLDFQCRLDGGPWSPCSSPHDVGHLRPGRHSFAVRALNRGGRVGPAAVRRWRVIAPVPAPGSEPVSIEPEELITPEGAPFAIEQVSTPPTLYPGSGPESLELRLINFASEPVTVTSLSVSLVRAPPGCGSENFELIPADVSPSDPIVIAAGSSLELPAQGASPPQIGLRELPVNQDACQGAELQLSFSGSGQR